MIENQYFLIISWIFLKGALVSPGLYIEDAIVLVVAAQILLNLSTTCTILNVSKQIYNNFQVIYVNWVVIASSQ